MYGLFDSPTSAEPRTQTRRLPRSIRSGAHGAPTLQRLNQPHTLHTSDGKNDDENDDEEYPDNFDEENNGQDFTGNNALNLRQYVTEYLIKELSRHPDRYRDKLSKFEIARNDINRRIVGVEEVRRARIAERAEIERARRMHLAERAERAERYNPAYNPANTRRNIENSIRLSRRRINNARRQTNRKNRNTTG